jgi:16S rRNA (cytosine967-C5)-methyltransferase
VNAGARLLSAIELLTAIFKSTRPADGIASGYFRSRRYMGAKDRRDVYDQVYRVLRNRARLDWHLARQGVEIKDARARLLAALAILDRANPESLAPHFDSHVERNPVGLTMMERKWVVGLGLEPINHPDMPDWVRYEYPEWLDERLRVLFGDRLGIEMNSMREEATLDLRVNTLKAPLGKVKAILASEGIEAHLTPLSPLGLRVRGRLNLMSLDAFRKGLFEVQDEGSQLVAQMVEAKPGEAIVDFCAGAGGKTLAIAAAMENKGRLMALDISEGRLFRSGERLRRAGVHNVMPHALAGPSDKWVKRNKGRFDAVLVDAPCSGTGTWRRNPDARWNLEPNDIEELVVLQGEILKSAARLVKPGGRLVYATCSLLPEENQQQVMKFLAEVPEFTLDKELQLTPAGQGTDGFYAARLFKSATAAPTGEPEESEEE